MSFHVCIFIYLKILSERHAADDDTRHRRQWHSFILATPHRTALSFDSMCRSHSQSLSAQPLTIRIVIIWQSRHTRTTANVIYSKAKSSRRWSVAFSLYSIYDKQLTCKPRVKSNARTYFVHSALSHNGNSVIATIKNWYHRSYVCTFFIMCSPERYTSGWANTVFSTPLVAYIVNADVWNSITSYDFAKLMKNDEQIAKATKKNTGSTTESRELEE